MRGRKNELESERICDTALKVGFVFIFVGFFFGIVTMTIRGGNSLSPRIIENKLAIEKLQKTVNPLHVHERHEQDKAIYPEEVSRAQRIATVLEHQRYKKESLR